MSKAGKRTTNNAGRSACVVMVLIACVLVMGPAHRSWGQAEARGVSTQSGERRVQRDATTAPLAREDGGGRRGFGMGPPCTPQIVASADAAVTKLMPAGPFQPTWDSLEAGYKVPQWFVDAKFGLFLHWGLYAVPAYHNEWYEKHMYGSLRQWHTEHFGPPDKFGYKNFIPMFTCDKFNADEWAALFKKSGAKYVIPTAQHHDNFALWDSDLTRVNARQMGPKRDLIGELAAAVRKQGLKFGLSNHGIENFTFIQPPADMVAGLKAKGVDLFDPQWQDIYHFADRSDLAVQKFLTDWVNRNLELIDKYQPDMLWFDNGVNHRYYDPLKLHVAAYYYNRAEQWRKEVSISTKDSAYAPQGGDQNQIASIIDFEKIGPRSPAGIRTGAWQVDDPIGTTWGYTSDMRVAGADSIVRRLCDTVSKNGNLLLNLSPRADGTIPQEQQNTLLEVGRWLEVNGEAIYGTHAWTKFGEGSSQGQAGLNIRFTVKGENLYAIILGHWPGDMAVITSLAPGQAPEGKITAVGMLGSSDKLEFSRDAAGLKVMLPSRAPFKYGYTIRITGLKMNPPPDGKRDFLRVEEGGFEKSGFRPIRIWNGDETDWGLNFSSAPQALRVLLATY